MLIPLRWFKIALLFGLMGCSKNYLSLRQMGVDSTYLSSSHVGSPDPRQENPPYGQKVVMDWVIPSELLEKKPELVFHVIYRNYTEEKIVYPIRKQRGVEQFSLLNEEYRAKGGLLTYSAEIQTEEDGKKELVLTWKHQLWVQLITFDENKEEIKDSVASQPRQGSVMETPSRRSKESPVKS